VRPGIRARALRAAGRELTARNRLDVEVWRGLSRFSGGSGVALTWSRALR